MKSKNIPILLLVLALLTSSSSAQKTELKISFGEQFFDALLDAVFLYAPPPEFSLAKVSGVRETGLSGNLFTEAVPCNESIKILRENSGVRTGVKFRDGQIHAPIAFSGNYNPPFIGCMPFTGLANAIIDLEFDQPGRRLIARARVLDVSLNGTGGIGSGLVARMVQGAIDKKINPIEIVNTDKVSFLLPIRNANVKMRAVGFAHDVSGGQLNIKVVYEFAKGN